MNASTHALVEALVRFLDPNTTYCGWGLPLGGRVVFPLGYESGLYRKFPHPLWVCVCVCIFEVALLRFR